MILNFSSLSVSLYPDTLLPVTNYFLFKYDVCIFPLKNKMMSSDDIYKPEGWERSYRQEKSETDQDQGKKEHVGRKGPGLPFMRDQPLWGTLPSCTAGRILAAHSKQAILKSPLFF